MLSYLLKSLRPLRFSEALRSLKSTISWLKSPYFDFLKKKSYDRIVEFQVKFVHPSKLRLWRTGMLLLTKSKGHKSNGVALGTSE